MRGVIDVARVVVPKSKSVPSALTSRKLNFDYSFYVSTAPRSPLYSKKLLTNQERKNNGAPREE